MDCLIDVVGCKILEIECVVWSFSDPSLAVLEFIHVGVEDCEEQTVVGCREKSLRVKDHENLSIVIL